MADDLFDYVEGVALRDEGIARVKAHSLDWHNDALLVVGSLPLGWEGLAEEYRPLVIERIGEPHSANCWGAVTMDAVRKGLLKGTDVWRSSRAKKSHARKQPVLRRI